METRSLVLVIIIAAFLLSVPASATMVDAIMISGEDTYSVYVMNGEDIPTVIAPETDLFLSGEDVAWEDTLTGTSVPTTIVPQSVLFLSGEDVLWEETLIWGDGPSPPSCGPDFNGNGYVDWGDVVKLAYYYWGLIDDSQLCL